MIRHGGAEASMDCMLSTAVKQSVLVRGNGGANGQIKWCVEMNVWRMLTRSIKGFTDSSSYADICATDQHISLVTPTANISQKLKLRYK